ncbi:hypothetical protein PF003_g8738 [Phytophthora fragariae]|nr:hypothetical protein PF003_g8738 [Phytophthora fragariae]
MHIAGKRCSLPIAELLPELWNTQRRAKEEPARCSQPSAASTLGGDQVQLQQSEKRRATH